MVWEDNSLGHILVKWGVFFFGFCNAIFCRHIQWTSKKFVHKQIQEWLYFWQNVTKIIDLVYIFIKINGFKGQLGRPSFMELLFFLFLRFCNGVFASSGWIYLTDLSAGLITTKNHKTPPKNIKLFLLNCSTISKLDQ